MTTTFFNPTEAPSVHIELLPSNAVAVKTEARDYVTKNSTTPAFFITVWAPRTTPMSCVGGQDSDEFIEEYCHGCSYYTEEMEFDASTLDYPELQTPEGRLEVTGTVFFNSPCPCYNDGLGDIEFPCHAGYDAPESDEECDEELGCEYMQYGVVRSHSGTLLTDWAQQQGIHFEAGYAAVTNAYPSINTFSGAKNICWGSNDSGDSLLEIEMLYTTSPANQDLLSFHAHNENNRDIAAALDKHNWDFDVTIIPLSEYNHRPKAVAVATASAHLNSYFLMTASGAVNHASTAAVPVELYRNVAVDDDTVLDVWVSDVVPAGCRLMFLMYPEEQTSVFLGQIPSDFNLQPCESIKQQSSAAAELVNS